MRNQQDPRTSPTPVAGGVGRQVAGVVAAVVLAALAVLAGVSNHEEPAARYVVVECQGFDALASVGGRQVSCGAESVEADAADDAAPEPADVQSRAEPAGARAKA